MKQNLSLKVLGALAFVAAITLNARHAINNYGVSDNKLHVEILAQTSTGGGTTGGGTTGGGTSGGSTSGVTPYNELPNNANGGNIFLYCNRDGKPDFCTIKKYVNASGSVKWTDGDAGAGYVYANESSEGIKEKCPNSGNGCTVYSCQATPSGGGGGTSD